MNATLWVIAVLDVVQAGLYAWLAVLLRPRDLAGADRAAMQCFRVYWAGLGAALLLSAAHEGLGALGILLLRPYMATGGLYLVGVAVGAWGLATYLVYVRTGHLAPRALGLVYAGLLAVALWGFVASDPLAPVPARWRVQFEFESASDAGLGFLTLAPLILSVFAVLLLYLSLWRHVSTTAQHYRIVMVVASVLLYFGVGIVSTVPALLAVDALQVFFRLSAVLAPWSAWSAFHPPAWVVRRSGTGAEA